MNEELLKILENCSKNKIDVETALEQVLDLFSVSSEQIIISKREYEDIKRDIENLQQIDFSM